MGSLANKAKPSVPPYVADSEEWLRKLASVVQNVTQGKVNVTGSVTLNNGGVGGWHSTTVSDARCGVDSFILLQATSQTGAIALDQWYIQTITDGSFTITHISTSTANCTAKYAILG